MFAWVMHHMVDISHADLIKPIMGLGGALLEAL